jgi:nitrate/nitrite transporter NarK
MDNTILAVLIGIGFALVFGALTARSSARREKIYGGTLAHVFHYIGAAGAVGVFPTVLAGLILKLGFGRSVVTGFSFVIVSLVALFLFALVEYPARQQRNL